MRTHPALREKIGSELVYGINPVLPARKPTQPPTRVNVFTSFFEGLFGSSNPQSDLTRDLAVPNRPGAFYNYHVGDIFTPGTQNYVFEPTTELTPLTTIWGNAFLSRPNAFKPLQPPQQYANYNKFINGIGGLVAGQMAMQPLESKLDF